MTSSDGFVIPQNRDLWCNAPAAAARGRGRRVLIMLDCLRPGGAEGQVILLIEILRARGWDPQVACLDRTGWHADSLSRLGLDPLELPLKGSLLKLNTARQVLRLAGYVRSEGIALIHAHDLYTNLVALAAGRLAGVPVVVSRLDLAHWFDAPRRRLMRWAQCQADAVFVNAQAIVHMLEREEQLDRSHMALIANGIDLGKFDAEAALEPSPPVAGLGPRTVIMVANMQHPVKGHRDLLFAADEVLLHVPDARFLLVGDGGLRPDYERLAARLGRTAQIDFIGRRQDVPRLLRRAGLAVSASYAEGLSNSVIEAMAAGLPVVATDAGGNVELVESGRSGYLVPVGQPGLMAARIVELLRHDRSRRTMGAAARRFVEDNLTADRMGESFSQLYDRLIECHGQRRGRAWLRLTTANPPRGSARDRARQPLAELAGSAS